MKRSLQCELVNSGAILTSNSHNKHVLAGNSSQVTQAVIIAAGKGSRLNGYQQHNPKPLVKVGGMPLLTRVILSAKKVGIKEFVIVIGYQAHKIRDAIDERKLGVKITWVHNRDWEKQNGVSVLKAEPFVDGKFFLFMSDHVFDTNTLKRVQQQGLNGNNNGTLCVDYAVNRIYDLEDATKVDTQDGRLLDLGKELTSFNAVDTGIFICTQDLFGALRQSQEEGDDSLSGGVRVLAKARKMNTFDIGDAFWQDVDTVADVRVAEKLLLNATRSKGDGIIAQKLNRPISNMISKWLLKTPITPNQISIFNMVFSFFTAWLIATGEPLYVMLGGLFFHLASIFDGCDGEVALVKLRNSKSGALLDTITDQISYIAFIIGVTIGAYNTTQNELLLGISGILLGFLVIALSLGLKFLKKQNSGSFRDFNRAVETLNETPKQVWYIKLFALLRPFGRRDMFAFLVFLLLLPGNVVFLYWLMIAFLFLYCTGSTIASLYMLSKPGAIQSLHSLRRYTRIARRRLFGLNGSAKKSQLKKKISCETSNSDNY